MTNADTGWCTNRCRPTQTTVEDGDLRPYTANTCLHLMDIKWEMGGHTGPYQTSLESLLSNAKSETDTRPCEAHVLTYFNNNKN